MANSKVVYESIFDLIEQKILPLMPDCTENLMLNGQKENSQKKGSKKPPKIVGYFQNNGKIFKLNDDSLYAPLLIAYDEQKKGKYPFVNGITKKDTITLELRDDLKQLISMNKKGFYAYTV